MARVASQRWTRLGTPQHRTGRRRSRRTTNLNILRPYLRSIGGDPGYISGHPGEPPPAPARPSRALRLPFPLLRRLRPRLAAATGSRGAPCAPCRPRGAAPAAARESGRVWTWAAADARLGTELVLGRRGKLGWPSACAWCSARAPRCTRRLQPARGALRRAQGARCVRTP